jgi:peptidoglycan biosynthesis protein MviN/MurJ (putative lipid II flippase)
MPFILKFILVLVAMILADVCWTMYFIEVEKRKPISAGLWGAAILLFGSVVTIGYVEDIRLLAAAVLGSFIGVAGTVQYKKRKEAKDPIDK